MESKFKLPTETVDLPSKGLLYSENSPLSSGTVEMKYMTAREEDILTNRNYISNGTVIDKLLKSLIVTKDLNFNDLLVGDKNAIMVAARILSYGKDYTITLNGAQHTVDLSTLEHKVLDESLYKDKKNEFEFTLPHTGNKITYKLLTHNDEIAIDKEIAGLKKIDKQASPEVTTRLKRMITSVNGMVEQKDIRDFVDNYLLAKDARAFRAEYSRVQPDINLKLSIEDVEEDVDLPIGLNFFWPDA
jgi:hypothetical protein